MNPTTSGHLYPPLNSADSPAGLLPDKARKRFQHMARNVTMQSPTSLPADFEGFIIAISELVIVTFLAATSGNGTDQRR